MNNSSEVKDAYNALVAAIKKAMAETAQSMRPTRRLKDIGNVGSKQSVIGLTKKR